MRIGYWNKAYSVSKILRDAMQELSGTKIWLTNKFPKVDVNFGNSGLTSLHNTREFIGLCVNKLAFSKVMKDNGVPSPEFFRGTPTIFPCLLRNSLTGFSGRGILPCRTVEDVPQAFNGWWTPFIRCKTEFRVHVLGGEFVKVLKKVPTREEPELPIRNSYEEYHYRNCDSFREWEKLIALQETLKPILSSGSFYALDLGYSSKVGYVVFEANSAPGLNHQTAPLYARYLLSQLGVKYVDNRPAANNEGGGPNNDPDQEG